MAVFLVVAGVCFLAFVLSFLAFDDIDLGDALDFVDDGSSGWFSLRAILLFGLGFGAAGATAMQRTNDPVWSSGIGVAYGAFVYLLGVALARIMMRQESNSLRSIDALVGKTAVCTVPMVEGVMGAVRVSTSKGVSDHPAICNDVVFNGSQVKIVGTVGNTLIVELKEAA